MPHRPWAQLGDNEKDQVRWMFLSLKEFSYGYDRAAEVAEEVPPGAAKLNFYMSSLYQYFASYFLVKGANKLRNKLEDLGCGDLLAPIEELLRVQMGDTTVGEIMRTWRDKALVHQTFTFKPIEKGVYSKVDLLDPDTGDLYSGIVTELFRRTQELYVQFVCRYPEALSDQRD